MKTESQRVGQYELRQRLRQDSGSETWRALDTLTETTVILKFYRTDLIESADLLSEYLQHIEQVASLHHPNIAHIHNVQVLAPGGAGTPSSLVCVAVEYVEGETLADFIKSTSAAGKIPTSTEIVQLFSSLALAIDSAHLRGLVHGNLKPANILLSKKAGGQNRFGLPVVTDFAASKLLPKKHGNEVPFYLAPEQLKNAPADKQSDIYALGILLYELYTGMPPFRGNRPIAVMMQHINASPTPPDLVNPSVSPAVTRVILRCLSKDPLKRYSTASALVAALAHALHVEVPDNLQRFTLVLGSTALPAETRNVQSSEHAARPVSTPPKRTPAGSVSNSWRDESFAAVRRRGNRSLILLAACGLVLILGAGFVAMLLMQQSAASSAHIGSAYFVNSGQFNENTTQGINDELQIELSGLPDPASGKSYYAWLLGDSNQTETIPLLLGRLTVQRGVVHFLYTGDGRHTNLLALESRFLITEEGTGTPASNPLLNQSTWRYYAVLSQTPDPADKLHFSMLDHLRHLLVESPELAIRGLHGGLAFWFTRGVATVSSLASTLVDEWQNKDAHALHSQIIRILDSLDGNSFVKADLPSATPFLADARIAQVPLLGPAPRNADPPGYVYQAEAPPGYVYLLQTHLDGVVLAPQATQEQHQIAVRISDGVDSVRRALTRVYQDAKQVFALNKTQLLQSSTLAILDDLTTQAQDAYTGQSNSATGSSQGGALWIDNNLQRLASFNILPYHISNA